MQPDVNGRTNLKLGATPISESQTHFSVWAPKSKSVVVERIVRNKNSEEVVSSFELTNIVNGFHSATLEGFPTGTLYRYRISNGQSRPDPRSRFQPFGVHGPSEVVDPGSFNWSDDNWTGIKKRDLVIYELHVGSFTEAGTYLAAIEQLDRLIDLGVTAIELLPLAQCPGKWNWGYDGVNFFAPSNNFGSPNDLKALINACHHARLAVILDVVYNHVGPEGNYLSEFGPYRAKQGTPWGDALDFGRDPVRRFVIDNVIYWLDEFHFDGLRLDAVHYMFDDHEPHILDEIQSAFRDYESRIDRQIHLIGESNIYDPELVGNVTAGAPNYDAIWSDCLMHSVYKAGAPELRLTNRHYEETDIAEAIEHAYVFSTPQAIRVTNEIRQRNHPEDCRRYIESLIMALQTHDSVGNHPHGKRIHQLTSIEFQKAAAPLFLLYPSIPMIFMGEEHATDAPFPFFADFEDKGLRAAVDKGRRDEYPHHDWKGSPLPSEPAAFVNSKSNGGETNELMFHWYRELLAFRKSGIAEGWLNVTNLQTDSNLELGIHQLIFHHPENPIRVMVRLANKSNDSIPFDQLGISDVLLDSRQPEKLDVLQTEHCLIWR